MPRRGDEIQVAANSLLGRMEIAEIMSAVDDPELLVASSRIQNFLVHRQHDERRKANLGVDRNDVGLGVLNGPRAGIRTNRRSPGEHPDRGEQKKHSERKPRDSREHRFLLTKDHAYFSIGLTEYRAGSFLHSLGAGRGD